MSKLMDFAKCDEHNLNISQEALLKLSPNSLDIAEMGYALLAGIPTLLSETELYDKYQKAIIDWAESVGLRGREALKLLQNAILIGAPNSEDLTLRAKEALTLAMAFVIRSWLTLRLQRDYVIGFLELFRLRSFTAFGTLRLQAETAALIRLMYDNPEVATEWLGTSDEVKGKKFHQEHTQQLNKLIRSWKLDKEYNEASGISQHSRFWGLAPGALLANKDRPHPASIGLTSIDIEDPRILLLWFCRMLRFYVKLLNCFEELFPDIDSSIFSPLIRPSFKKQVDKLWALYRQRYAQPRRKVLGKY